MTDAMQFRGAGRMIDGDGPYRDAADRLGCELAAVQAVAEVESRGAPFLRDGRPVILFERHIFRRMTGGRFSASHPAISGPPGGYGAPAAHQHERMARAVALDRTAALRSTSWGAFQVMGFNAERCGWSDVEAFVADICEDEAAHLRAFVGFVLASPALVRAIRARDWTAFARGYNGPNFAINRYDTKMAAAYARHAAPTSSPALTRDHIAAVQAALSFAAIANPAFHPGPADGLMGPRTRAALRAMADS